MKEKMTQETQSSKPVNKGFTLVELMVVVLIIGILAAIALPQYQMAVAKSKFATMKNNVKAFIDAEDRYYLVHNQYTTDLSVLDIENEGANCGGASWDGVFYFHCGTTIGGKQVYLLYWKTTSPYYDCYIPQGALSPQTSLEHRLCQEESGKKTPGCDSSNCHYYYR